MSHNPCAGIIRIRFGGYNLSPKAPLCSSDAKIVQGERKSKTNQCFFFSKVLKVFKGQVQLASANLAKSLKNSFFGVEKPSFFLGLKFSFFATLRT